MSEIAIRYFVDRTRSADITEEERLYNSRAIAALEKRVPMLVHHERTFWTYRHYCPACQDQLRIEALKYCDNCGQHLDWSTYELGLKYVK